MLGDSTDAAIQGIIVFVFGLLLGMRLNVIMFLEAFPVMMLTTFGLVSIGLTIASFIENLESFGVVQNFVNLPIFLSERSTLPRARNWRSRLVADSV